MNLLNDDRDALLINGLTIQQFITILRDIFESPEFDANGSIDGFPLFERMEDRRKSGTNLEGLIPLLCDLMNKKLPPTLKIDREHRYPLSNYRCDIVVRDIKTNEELWLELKQHWTKPSTPYETAFTIDEYKRDIEKFYELPENYNKSVLIIAYEHTADFPQYLFNKLNAVFGNSKFYHDGFDIITESNGQCTCHLLFWVIKTTGMKNLEESSFKKEKLIGNNFEKDLAIDSLIKYLDEKCKSGELLRYYDPERGKRPAYYGYFLKKRGRRGWVLLCWSEEFENKYGITPYWLEFSEGPAQQVVTKWDEWKEHPSKPFRVIVPINIEEFNNLGELSEKIYNFALGSLS